MSRNKIAEEETYEFQRIFSGLSPNNRQYSMAVLRSLQFAEEQERAVRTWADRPTRKTGGENRGAGNESRE
jgi:hypothetical protein